MIRRAASRIFALRPTMQGLLPPSSSVTGVRFFAAASITTRPYFDPPVKKIESKRRFNNSSSTSPPPSTKATYSGPNVSAIRSRSAAST